MEALCDIAHDGIHAEESGSAVSDACDLLLVEVSGPEVVNAVVEASLLDLVDHVHHDFVLHILGLLVLEVHL